MTKRLSYTTSRLYLPSVELTFSNWAQSVFNQAPLSRCFLKVFNAKYVSQWGHSLLCCRFRFRELLFDFLASCSNLEHKSTLLEAIVAKALFGVLRMRDCDTWLWPARRENHQGIYDLFDWEYERPSLFSRLDYWTGLLDWTTGLTKTLSGRKYTEIRQYHTGKT